MRGGPVLALAATLAVAASLAGAAPRSAAPARLVHGEGAWDTDPCLAVGAVLRFGR
jgi:hypothetical protein